jgi:hypothetical protein
VVCTAAYDEINPLYETGASPIACNSTAIKAIFRKRVGDGRHVQHEIGFGGTDEVSEQFEELSLGSAGKMGSTA